MAEELASRIKTIIFAGELKPGQKLNQGGIAQQFAVSRTPVREALQILQAHGLVAFNLNKGAFVRRLTRRECAESYLVRAELESLAAELAAVSISKKGIANLARLNVALQKDAYTLVHNELSNTRMQRTRDSWIQGNDRFHEVLVGASECQALEDCMRFVLSKLPRTLTWLAIEKQPRILEAYVKEHAEIIDALSLGDARRARRAAHQHVVHARQSMLAYFDSTIE